jgi:hypothetical protein
MTNGSLYTCDALFYDPGYTDDYPAGQDFVYTIYPSSPNSNVKVQFNSFNVEYDSNCIYDYLEIYNAENTSSGFIGQYCGTNNPGTITASNPLGALTFYFHADGGVEEFGWDATVSCEDIVTSINENSDNSFRIYPNPANTYVQVESKNLKGESIKVFDITGKIVKSTIINSYNEELVTIDISDLEKGVYFIKINSSSQKFIKL